MKVILFGYYGFRNVGDEQLLDESIRLLKEIFQNIKYVVAAGPNPLPFKTFHRMRIFSWFYHLYTSNALIFGGGSIFQSKTSFRSLFFYIIIVQLAKLFNTKVILLCHGLGPFRSFVHEILARFVLNQQHVVRSWRDKKASELFPNTNDRVFCDLTLLQERVAKVRATNNNESIIGLSLIDLNLNSKIMETLKDKKQFTIQYIINQPLDFNFNSDHFLLEDIWDKSPTIDFLITQRYHSAIWASKYGIPWLAISDDPKLISLANQANQSIFSLKDPNLSTGILEFLLRYKEPFRDKQLMDWYDSFKDYRHRIKDWLHDHLSSI